MPGKRVDFHSEGTRLSGDLFLPDDLRQSEKRAGIVLCHGYTGVRNLYLPDTAKALTDAGYVVLTFDYKGWGDSDGPKSRLSPYGRVIDSQAALTFLAAQPMVDANRLGYLRHQLRWCYGRMDSGGRSAGQGGRFGGWHRTWPPLDAQRSPAG